MSLTRKMLEAMGIEADKVATIIEAHAETVDALKAQAEKYKVDAEANATAKSDLEKVTKELTALKAGGSNWQEKFEKEHADFEAFKTDIANKELKANKENAYKGLLKDAGVSDKHVDKILRVTDLNNLEIGEDGAFKNAEELAKNIKTEWADFIGKESKQGAGVSHPQGNAGGGRTFTHDEIAKMSRDEINANWDAISASLNK